MFETIQYLVSSKKPEDGFGMDNVALVNSKGKMTRLYDGNMGLDHQFINHNIARVLHNILNRCYGLEIFFYFSYFYLVHISYPVTCSMLFNTLCHQRS